MKNKLVLLILLLIFSTFSFSQSSKEKIKEDIIGFDFFARMDNYNGVIYCIDSINKKIYRIKASSFANPNIETYQSINHLSIDILNDFLVPVYFLGYTDVDNKISIYKPISFLNYSLKYLRLKIGVKFLFADFS